MFEATLSFECKNPEIIKKSLEPDIKNDKYSTTEIETKNGLLVVKIKSEKITHLKGIVNTYISLVNMLIETEDGVI